MGLTSGVRPICGKLLGRYDVMRANTWMYLRSEWYRWGYFCDRYLLRCGCYSCWFWGRRRFCFLQRFLNFIHYISSLSLVLSTAIRKPGSENDQHFPRKWATSARGHNFLPHNSCHLRCHTVQSPDRYNVSAVGPLGISFIYTFLAHTLSKVTVTYYRTNSVILSLFLSSCEDYARDHIEIYALKAIHLSHSRAAPEKKIRLFGMSMGEW